MSPRIALIPHRETTDRNSLFQGLLIGASVLLGLRGCKTSLPNKKDKKSSSLDSGQKKKEPASENSTSLDRGLEGSSSKDKGMFFDKVIFCENV